jgi:GT2 family glycosyltransferase
MTDVIVLDVDGGTMLEECIASIFAQTVKPTRVIVFDNGSHAPVFDRLAAGSSQPAVDRSTAHRPPPTAYSYEILRTETNVGFARAVNDAFRHTTAPYVALINNDVILDRDWLEQVRDALDRDEKLAGVQTIIRRPDGRIDGAGIDIGDGTFRQIGYGQALGTPLAVPWGISATAALFRRAALGPRIFDERFFAYYEDVELSARLHRDGWRIAVLPVVKATHRGSQSARVLPNAQRLRTRNRYLVARMHKGVGRIRALLWEDMKLLPRGRSSLRGIIDGLFG